MSMTRLQLQVVGDEKIYSVYFGLFVEVPVQ